MYDMPSLYASTPQTTSAEIPSNVHIVGESDARVDCNSSFHFAKLLFARIAPNEEFLPLGVEPQQAQYGGEGSGSGEGGVGEGEGAEVEVEVGEEEAYIARALQDAQNATEREKERMRAEAKQA